MKRIFCLLVSLILVFAMGTVSSSAAEAKDYTVWKWAQSANGGSVVDNGNNTVTVSGKGVWDVNDIESVMGITYKEQVSVNGFKCNMKFNRFYGDGVMSGDGWYGIMLHNKPYGITHPDNYKAKNMKGIVILFKINKSTKARKTILIELNTNGYDGIKSIPPTGIYMEVPNDWEVDVEIKGGKLYICNMLCYDISKAISERLGDGKCYPSFIGFAEDYGDVSFTLNYAQKPAGNSGTTSKPTNTSKPANGNNATTSKVEESTTSKDEATDSKVEDTTDSKTESTVSDSDVTEQENSDNTEGTNSKTDTDEDKAQNNANSNEPEKGGNSILWIAIAVAAVLIIGSVVACIFILKK